MHTNGNYLIYEKQKHYTIPQNEKRKLYVSKENPTRLKEILKKLDYLYYGIK